MTSWTKLPRSPRARRRLAGAGLGLALILGFQNCGGYESLRYQLGSVGQSSSAIGAPAGGGSTPVTITPPSSTPPSSGTTTPAVTPVPLNPFGIGVAYIAIDQDAGSRVATRNAQIQLASALVGQWGHVRIWCATWDNPAIGLVAVNECAAAIAAAYASHLVPIINFTNPYPTGPDDYIDPATFAKDTTPPHKVWTSLAAWYKAYVAQLPRKDGVPLFIEFGNEPNFTDWWKTQTCYFWIRAAEFAEALGAVADAIHSIGDGRIKVLTGALAAFSDSDPQFQANGLCARGGTLNLPSSQFAAAMYNERPDVFGPNPKIDGWNSHPYPLLAYGQCTVNVNCPDPGNDPTQWAYRAEMQAVHLPSNFPVFVTEMGYSTISGSAQWVANSTVASYPTWLNRNLPYNNVQGVTGYLLGNAGDTYSYVVDGVPQPVYSAVQTLRRTYGYAD